MPIIKIFCEGTINQDYKIPGTFSIIDQDKNKLTSTIGIRYRGASSLGYPKKHFRIEFWADQSGKTKDVSLLGMRSDDDWNLQAMYNEPLRIRNKTTFDLWRNINKLHYQSSEPSAINSARLEYVELFFNNEYRGIYCLGEPVDRKQLQLKKYDETTNTIRGELYKGVTWGGAVTFTSRPSYSASSTTWGGFEYKYPDEINPYWKNLYDFVNFVMNSSDQQFYAEYKFKFDFDNLVDYFIFLNLTRATDNTGKNIFIAKYKEDAPYFYVPWDLDGVFGTIWTGNRENITTGILSNGLYNRLLKNYQGNDFKKKVKQKWNQLVSDGLTYENLITSLKDNHDYLLRNGIYEKEAKVWSLYHYSFDDFNYLSTWLSARYNFLDQTFNRYEGYSEETANVYINEINGNEKWLEIYNAEEEEIDLSGYIIQKIDEDGIIANWAIPPGTKISAGKFLYWTQDKDCTDGSTFTWGISAKKNVAFKIYDSNGNPLDHFVVTMPDLYSEGSRTVGRKTDGADELVIFEKGTPGSSNSVSAFINQIKHSDRCIIQSGMLIVLDDVSLVTITDYSGKIILKQPASAGRVIDMNRLPTGIYLLQFQLNDKIEVMKFVNTIE